MMCRLLSCSILILLLCSSVDAFAQPVIRDIVLDQRDVFDRRHNDWFFAGDILNAFHTMTKPYLIEDELLFEEGDDLDTVDLLETERNLRRTGLFSAVRVYTEPVGADSVDVVVYCQDRFSLRPAILFGTGGGITNIGGKVDEINVAGTGTKILVQGLYRTENDIGWEGLVQLYQRRLFRTELSLNASLMANQYRTDQTLGITRPFRTLSTPVAYSISGTNAFGRDFAYVNKQPILLPFHQRSLNTWISQAYGDRDRLFMTGSVSADWVQRTIPSSRQAFDNTARLLVAFSSIRQNFQRSVFLNGYETEDLQTGAWGTAVMGRVFSMGNGGESMWYIGGQAEQSAYVAKDVYLFGRVGAGSRFGDRRAKYTYLEVMGLGHLRISPHVVIAARLRSQTAWNWSAFRQLVLDNDAGLRGYAANQLAGDNRLIGNAEFRWFPDWKVWILGLSGALFYDGGTVWNQGTGLNGTRFHHAVGFGIRFHNLKASGEDATFRFDFAYNLDERRFTGIIFTTDQLFSAFGQHQFKVPDVFGRDIDVE